MTVKKEKTCTTYKKLTCEKCVQYVHFLKATSAFFYMNCDYSCEAYVWRFGKGNCCQTWRDKKDNNKIGMPLAARNQLCVYMACKIYSVLKFLLFICHFVILKKQFIILK